MSSFTSPVFRNDSGLGWDDSAWLDVSYFKVVGGSGAEDVVDDRFQGQVNTDRISTPVKHTQNGRKKRCRPARSTPICSSDHSYHSLHTFNIHTPDKRHKSFNHSFSTIRTPNSKRHCKPLWKVLVIAAINESRMERALRIMLTKSKKAEQAMGKVCAQAISHEIKTKQKSTSHTGNYYYYYM